MKWTVYVAMVGITLVYLIIGAAIFHVIERDDETAAKESFVLAHKEFLNNFTCISPDDLQKYIVKILQTQSAGVSVTTITHELSKHNMSSSSIDYSATKWDIPSSILFCITVISTIGYGNMSPKTWEGQLFCIFYALIGIPMFAAVLVGTGERLQIPIKKIHKGRPWIKDNKATDEKLKSIVFLTVGTCGIVFLPSYVFNLTQGWTYLESVYYTVITLTTVGFGDLVPGYFEKPAETQQAKTQNFYRVLLGIWILFGLSWGALILSEIGSLLQTQITTAARETQEKLVTLENIVKKKAKETKDKLVKKDKASPPDKDHKAAGDVEIGARDRETGDELKYEPTDSD